MAKKEKEIKDVEKIEEVKEKVSVKHYQETDPYRVDNPEPGMTYAVVTTSDKGQYNACLNVGWEPVIAKNEPKLFDEGGYVDPKTGYYTYRELVWCKIPANVMEERKVYMQELVKQRSLRLSSPKEYMKMHEHIGAEITNKPDTFIVTN